MRQRPVPVTDDIASRPTSFEVGAHVLLVAKLQERRWTVAVDARVLDQRFDTQADAWEAGVREADRLDALLPK